MPTLFTKIITRSVPAHIVAEDADHIAFLDIYPMVVGHTLVVPKQEVGCFWDLSEEGMGSLMRFARGVRGALGEVVPCARVGLLVMGLEVPHVHVHLLPVQEEKDVVLGERRVRALDDVLKGLASQVRGVWEDGQGDGV